jgi:hypothetical protein
MLEHLSNARSAVPNLTHVACEESVGCVVTTCDDEDALESAARRRRRVLAVSRRLSGSRARFDIGGGGKLEECRVAIPPSPVHADPGRHRIRRSMLCSVGQ